MSPAPKVLVETSQALPIVSMTISTRTGSTADPVALEGLSRITQRLVRRTGAGLTTEALDERIDTLGASVSVECGHSSASVHGAVIGRSLDAYADLLVDILAKPSLATDELGKLKRETLAELIEARDHDRELSSRWFRQKLYDGHPYGRPTAGTPTSVEKITGADVAATYGRAFSPKNLVFAFAGAIDEQTAHAIAARMVDVLPRNEPPSDVVAEPSQPPGRHMVFVDKPERTQTQIMIGCLGTHAHDPDHVALHVGNTIFGGTFTARLMKEVRSKRGWSYGAYSNLPYDRKRRGFSLWTFPKASDAAACVALELSLLTKWWEGGVTPRELAWAQRYLVRSHAFAIDTASKRVGQLLDEEIYDLPTRYHADYLEHVRAVTLEDVNAAIRKRITPENLIFSVVGTASEIKGAIENAIPDLNSTDVVPFDA